MTETTKGLNEGNVKYTSEENQLMDQVNQHQGLLKMLQIIDLPLWVLLGQEEI